MEERNKNNDQRPKSERVKEIIKRLIKKVMDALPARMDEKTGLIDETLASDAELTLILRQMQVLGVRGFSAEESYLNDQEVLDRMEDFVADDRRRIWYWFMRALGCHYNKMTLSPGRTKEIFNDARRIAMDARCNIWVNVNWHRYKMIAGQYGYDEATRSYTDGCKTREMVVMTMVSWLLMTERYPSTDLQDFTYEVYNTWCRDTFNLKLLELMIAKGHLVVSEADEAQPSAEAKALAETQPEALPNTGTKDKPKGKRKSRGRDIESLFMKEDGTKDESLTRRMAEGFVQHLAELGIKDTPVDTKKRNRLNKAFAEAYAEWDRSGLVTPMPNGGACYRFLSEECHLIFNVAERSYVEFIRKHIFIN